MSEKFNGGHQAILAENDGDAIYGQAWDEGVEAFKNGFAFESNPYPKADLIKDGWEASRKYLGWNDGHFHGQYLPGRCSIKLTSHSN